MPLAQVVLAATIRVRPWKRPFPHMLHMIPWKLTLLNSAYGFSDTHDFAGTCVLEFLVPPRRRLLGYNELFHRDIIPGSSAIRPHDLYQFVQIRAKELVRPTTLLKPEASPHKSSRIRGNVRPPIGSDSPRAWRVRSAAHASNMHS